MCNCHFIDCFLDVCVVLCCTVLLLVSPLVHLCFFVFSICVYFIVFNCVCHCFSLPGGKRKSREVEQLAVGHTANRKWNQDSHLSLSDLGTHALFLWAASHEW